MTLQRMGNVLIVVDDLVAAKAFFIELGMELKGEMPLEGHWLDLVIGLTNVKCEIAMMDGLGMVTAAPASKACLSLAARERPVCRDRERVPAHRSR